MSPVFRCVSRGHGWWTATGWRGFLVGAGLAAAGLALIGAGMPALTGAPFDLAAAATRPAWHGQAAAPVAADEPRLLAESAIPVRARPRHAGAVAGRQREWVAGEGGVDAATAFPGWDLRLAITEMANSQRGFRAKPCLCAKTMIGRGPR